MLGKNIIELQEELSYMPMQRLIDEAQNPNSIYGSLTLVEIKNREALNSSSTDMSMTPTVTEDVISSVTSPAALDSSSPNLSDQGSGGIGSFGQQPVQRMFRGERVEMSMPMERPRGVDPIPSDLEIERIINKRNRGQTLTEEELNILENNRGSILRRRNANVNTGRQPKSRMKEGKKVETKESFPDLNNDGKVTYADILEGRGVERAYDGGEVDDEFILPEGGLMDLLPEGETPYLGDKEAITPEMFDELNRLEDEVEVEELLSMQSMKEGGEVETEEDDFKLVGKGGALFDPTNPLDYALAVSGVGAVGLGVKGLSTLYKAYKSGKIGKKAMVNAWKKIKNPAVGESGPLKPSRTQRFVGAAVRNPKPTAFFGGIGGLTAYNVLDPFAPEPTPIPSPSPQQSTSSLISSQLDEARNVFGYPTREEREAKDRRMLMMGLGSNIAGATNFNEIIQGNYDLMADQEARERSGIADDIAMVQGIQSLDPRSQRIAELESILKLLSENDTMALQSPQGQMLLQEYISLVSGQSNTGVAPTGGEVLQSSELAGTLEQLDNL